MLLGAQVLLDRHRVVGAALDGGVVGQNQAGPAFDNADPGDETGGRDGVLPAVEAVGGKGRDLQERRPGIEQQVDPVAGEQLAAAGVLGPGRFGAAEPNCGQPGSQLVDEFAHAFHLISAVENRPQG
ncbi:MAG: hypothetical protein V9F00_12985 [Nocardioides sp.]